MSRFANATVDGRAFLLVAVSLSLLAMSAPVSAQWGGLSRAFSRGSRAIGKGAARGGLGGAAQRAGRGTSIGSAGQATGRVVVGAELVSLVARQSRGAHVLAEASDGAVFLSRTELGELSARTLTTAAEGSGARSLIQPDADLYIDLPLALEPLAIPASSGQRFVLGRDGQPRRLREVLNEGDAEWVVDMAEAGGDALDVIDLIDFAITESAIDPAQSANDTRVLLVPDDPARCASSSFERLSPAVTTLEELDGSLDEVFTRFVVIARNEERTATLRLVEAHEVTASVVFVDAPCSDGHDELSRALQRDLARGGSPLGYRALSPMLTAQVRARDPLVVVMEPGPSEREEADVSETVALRGAWFVVRPEVSLADVQATLDLVAPRERERELPLSAWLCALLCLGLMSWMAHAWFAKLTSEPE